MSAVESASLGFMAIKVVDYSKKLIGRFLGDFKLATSILNANKIFLCSWSDCLMMHRK